MKLTDFYAATKEEREVLSKSLTTTLVEFVKGFGLYDIQISTIFKVIDANSPVQYALGILLTKISDKKILMACELGINVFKPTDKQKHQMIIIRPKLKCGFSIQENFLDRYVEFVQGHLNIFGPGVKVLKK